jgi:hypothetical protein
MALTPAAARCPIASWSWLVLVIPLSAPSPAEVVSWCWMFTWENKGPPQPGV